MKVLPEQSAEILRLRHYGGLTFAAVGEIHGTPPDRVRQIEAKALRHLRKPNIARTLRPFYDFDFYCGTSLGSFQHTGMSVQERYVVMDEKRKEQTQRHQAKT